MSAMKDFPGLRKFTPIKLNLLTPVPSDIEIRRNHFFKPLDWLNQSWLVKNLFELKMAQDVLFEGSRRVRPAAAEELDALPRAGWLHPDPDRAGFGH